MYSVIHYAQGWKRETLRKSRTRSLYGHEWESGDGPSVFLTRSYKTMEALLVDLVLGVTSKIILINKHVYKKQIF